MESPSSDKKKFLRNENIDENTLLKNENIDSYLTYSITDEIRKDIPNRYSFQIVEPHSDGKKKLSGNIQNQDLTLGEKWKNSKLRSVLG